MSEEQKETGGKAVVVYGAEVWDKFVQPKQDGSIQIDARTPFEAWEVMILGTLENQRRNLRILGLLLVFGKKAYSDKYTSVIDAMKYNPQTAMNAEWVVNAVGPRCRDELSFTHHEKVARLTEEAQKEILDIAVTEKLAASKMGKIIKAKYPPKRKPGKKKEPKALDIDPEDHAQVMNAAQIVVSAFENKLNTFRKWQMSEQADFINLAKAFRQMARRATGKN